MTLPRFLISSLVVVAAVANALGETPSIDVPDDFEFSTTSHDDYYAPPSNEEVEASLRHRPPSVTIQPLIQDINNDPDNSNTKTRKLSLLRASPPGPRQLGEEEGQTPLDPTSTFRPLPCNADLDRAPCVPFESLFPASTDDEVVVECGTCVHMGRFSDRKYVLDLRGGINVLGQLYFPEKSRVTVKTPHMFVQGKLSMKNTQPVNGQEHVRIVLTGEDDVVFVPHEHNVDSCGGEGYGCNVGPRPIVVAGGQLDVVGLKDGCPSWFRPERSLVVKRNDIIKYYPSNDVVADTLTSPGQMCHELTPPSTALYRSFLWKESDPYNDVLTASVVGEGDAATTRFTLSNRTKEHSTLTFDISPHCAQTGATYHLSAWVKVDTDDPAVTTTVQLKVYRPNGRVTYPALVRCAPRRCNTLVRFTEDMKEANRIEILFVTDGSTADVSYTGIEFAYHYRPSVTEARSVEECWRPGATVAATSQGVEDDGSGTGTGSSSIVDTIRTVDRAAGVSFAGPLGSAAVDGRGVLFTQESGGIHATEFILLSRNIVVTSEDYDKEGGIGGHVVILRTEGVSQRVHGLGLVGMGQENVLGRNPLNIETCGSVPGTRIDKNLILDSKNRCIVLGGSSDVIVADNAAYNTVGHCYVLEDGSEINNVLEGNIGALTKPASEAVRGEDDHLPTTFLLSNPQNVVDGNVAAGSYESGFWFRFMRMVAGESAVLHPSMIPQTMTLTSFDGNVAHSNRVAGIKIWAVHPPQRATISRAAVYRNRNAGIIVHDATRLTIENAHLSDNLMAIDLNLADTVVVRESVIVGYSDAYRAAADRGLVQRPDTHCEGRYGLKAHMLGLELHSVLSDRTTTGPHLEDVRFVNYGDFTGCSSSRAIEVSDDVVDAVYEPKTRLVGIALENTIDDSPVNAVSLCLAEAHGVTGVYIDDDGGINPKVDDSSPGVIVNQDSKLIPTGTECTSMGEGSCAVYCPGICMRSVEFALSAHDTTNVKVVIENSDNGEVIELTRSAYKSVNQYQDTLWDQRRTFAAVLPVGNFVARFVRKKDDVVVWPAIHEVMMGAVPQCSNYIEYVELYAPPLEGTECFELISDKSFESGDARSAGWYHSGGGIKDVQPQEDGSGWSLSTHPRVTWQQGPAYFVDTRCINYGSIIDFSALVKLQHHKGYAMNCDWADSGSDKCPAANVFVRQGGKVTQVLWDMTQPTGEWNVDAWNTISGRFEVTKNMAAADGVAIFVARTHPSKKIVLGEVSAQILQADCGNIVFNGDFVLDDLIGWRPSADTNLRVMADGSLGILNREFFHSGVSQLISKGCLATGNSYEIHAKFRLANSRGIFACDPYRPQQSRGDSCPSIGVTIKKDGEYTSSNVASVVAPYSDARWNRLYGVVTITEEMMEADEIRFYFSGAPPGVNVFVDNLLTKPAKRTSYGRRNCKQLIKNPKAARGDATFWQVSGDSGSIRVMNNIFYHVNRGEAWNSMFQFVDQTCVKAQSKWRIEAQVKLRYQRKWYWCDKQCNPGNGACKISAGRCPVLYLMLKIGHRKKYIELQNQVPKPWLQNNWNPVVAEFTADELIMSSAELGVAIGGVNGDIQIAVDSFEVTPI